MRELRREAIHRPGYISGETLRDLDEAGRYLIVSTWRSRRAWEDWSASETRRGCEREIGHLLVEPERVHICEPF